MLASLDTGDPVTAAGGLLLMTSYSILAQGRFGDMHLPRHEDLVMANYATPQACLAHGVSNVVFDTGS